MQRTSRQREAPPGRGDRRQRLADDPLDVLVVGGGITGAGIALDLALRGLRAGLVERGDWAGATSSASSRLVHGGLRYLEQLEVGLVRESCLERGLLLRNAAGLVWPEQFTFPLRRGERVGPWTLAAGLALYTLVSLPRALGLPRMLSAGAVARRLPAIERAGLRGGGSYLDGATDDARLTLAVVSSALAAGAVCLSRTELVALENGARGVEAELADALDGQRTRVRARAAVLAGGPFTDELRARAGLAGGWLRPTRGTHVVVPRERLPTDGAVIFPSAVDGRVMFLIPWPRRTVIGTTDLDPAPGAPVRATRTEVRYLLDSANALAPVGLREDDVVATWAGLRPLLAAQDDRPSARSREERVQREGSLWTIAGGKLTGYRAMAETLGARLCNELGLGHSARRSPTREHLLHGAFRDPVPRPRWSSLDARGQPQAQDPLATAWLRRYAAFAPELRAFCAADGRGEPLDPETLAGEVEWAARHEDCLTAEDFLLRRTDLGYAPRAQAQAQVPRVLERLGAALGWSEDERAREARRADDALERLHAWRADAP